MWSKVWASFSWKTFFGPYVRKFQNFIVLLHLSITYLIWCTTRYTISEHVYLLKPQGAQNYEAHNVLLNLLWGAQTLVPQKSKFLFLKLSFDCFITCDVFNITCCIDMDSFSDTSKAVILVAISIVHVFKIKHLKIGFRNILDPAFVVSNTKVCLTAVFLFRDLPDLFFRYNVTFYSIKKCQVHFITLF